MSPLVKVVLEPPVPQVIVVPLAAMVPVQTVVPFLATTKVVLPVAVAISAKVEPVQFAGSVSVNAGE